MNLKYPNNILAIGFCLDVAACFLVILFIDSEFSVTYALATLLILIYILQITKSEDLDSLIIQEHNLLFVNVLAFSAGVFLVAISFSEFMSQDLRYFGLGFGGPSLIAMLYWGYRKRSVKI